MPTANHPQEAREIRLPFPCGCLDAHTGGGMAVKEHTCETHRAIASALSSRDVEVREVLEGLITCALDEGDGPVLHWCPISEDSASDCTPACLATQRLWSRLQS